MSKAKDNPYGKNRDKHPMQISVGYNAAMGAWDLLIGTGNFESQEAAKRYADRIKEFLEDEAQANFHSVQ